MTDLLTALQSAERGSRELDTRVVAWAEGVIDGEPWSDADLAYALTDPDRTCNPDHATTSIDAAKALIDREMPGATVSIEIKAERTVVALHPQPIGKGGSWQKSVSAPTPPLALVIALVRAKETQNGTV